MAMLAEPRRRKKYNLCPRGKALYEDDSRFGTKMLEKMGWTKGRGLGAKEDGSQEFVRVRFKNDAEGLGFEMRDDQWTEHEEGFNGLLKALNGGDTNGENDKADNGNASASEEEARPMGFGFKSATAPAEPEEVKPKTLKEKISGVSLEEKSKYSKARVHYKKFTRGKDLAQYSEKDLANIFGKKVNDELTAPIVDTPPEKAVEEEKPINPNFAGVQTVSTGLSVSDYFKQKMEAMKNRLSNIASSKTIETNSFLNGAEAQTETASAQGSEEEKEEVTEKKKKKKDKKKKQEEAEIEQPEETVTEKKKKKKSKRAAEDVLEETNPPKRKKKEDKQEADEEEVEKVETPEETEPPKKKSKKSKRDEKEETIEATETSEITEVADVEVKKKKKKKSKQTEEAAAETTTVEPQPTEETALKTKKKSKKILELSNEVQDLTQDEPLESTIAAEPTEVTEVADVEVKKKKNKSKHTKEATIESPEVEPEPTEETALKTKKKSKKILEVQDLPQDVPLEPTIPTETTEVTEDVPTKKKKNKKSKQTEANPVVEPEPTEEAVCKKKSKKTGEATVEVLDLTQDDQATATNAMEPTVDFVKPKKSKKKQKTEVSANNGSDDDESDSEAEAKADAQNYLTMDELIQKLDSYNEFTISSFCAEKFHTLNMNAFKNSTLAQITGYTFDDNIKLKILDLKDDERRILDLWAGNKSKYDKVRTNQLRTFKKRYMRLKPADIKRLSQIKAFSGI